MKKCKCGAPAEYDSPETLCGECWAAWWAEDDGSMSDEEHRQHHEEALAAVNEIRRKEAENA